MQRRVAPERRLVIYGMNVDALIYHLLHNLAPRRSCQDTMRESGGRDPGHGRAVGAQAWFAMWAGPHNGMLSELPLICRFCMRAANGLFDLDPHR